MLTMAHHVYSVTDPDGGNWEIHADYPEEACETVMEMLMTKYRPDEWPTELTVKPSQKDPRPDDSIGMDKGVTFKVIVDWNPSFTFREV